MKTDYCVWPPQIASDVEINQQQDGDRLAFIAGAASVGRYLILRATEHRVLQLIGGTLTPSAVCHAFKRQYVGTLTLTTLSKFLARLDEMGILAGERVAGHHPPEQQLTTQFYLRFSLFNPDRPFTWMVSRLRWVWTTPFFVLSLIAILVAALLGLINGSEVAAYGGDILREHYIAVIVAGLLIGISHEFAHGLTCKAFGGRATEVGGLLIYYCLPALYCNVSGLHLIPHRGRRLWVIAAGIYWQLLVGAFALLLWLIITPHTLLSDLTFIFFCGSVLDVVFNGNPLIKLDGYYFLSQWLRMPNLMDRARVWWRGWLRRITFGERDEISAQFSQREWMILAAFGLLSFVYTLGLRVAITIFLGTYLVEWFHLPGLLLTVALALFYARRPLRQLSVAGLSTLRKMSAAFAVIFPRLTEAQMADQDRTTSSTPEAKDQSQINAARGREERPRWRRGLVPITVLSLVAVVLCVPWNSSVGNYGMLVAIPGQEAIIRAPESATLVGLRLRPGDLIASGAVIGRMGNLELEDQLTQIQAELDRVNADYDGLLGELKTRGEAITRAEVNLRQRREEYDESNFERRQIEERKQSEPKLGNLAYLTASSRPAPSSDAASAATYPAAIAVLQSDADLRHAKLAEASLQLERTQRLHAQGIVPSSELDQAETRVSTITIEFAAARQRLDASLVEHRRRHINLATEMHLAHSDSGAERLRVAKLEGELQAMRALTVTLTSRRDLLQRRIAHFSLVTPQAGAVFGQELPRLVGQFFQKGAEICRVADTRQLLVRIQVPEHEIGDVHVGYPIRLKVRAFPDQAFRGKVSKIGSESETGQNTPVTYRVELVIENADDLLRPGMTAFARIDSGRRMLGAILLHKLKQALRPELWMM